MTSIMAKTGIISCVLYDMDGLLLNTEPFYTEVTQTIVGRYGKVFDWSIKSKMIGKKSIDSARLLVEALDLPFSGEDYLAERESMLQRLFPTAQAMPGAVRLTTHLHSHNIPQAVATSSDMNMFKLKTERHQEWFGCFNQVVTGDDVEVKQGKPAPDIFLAAARRLGKKPEQCLVFEDAPSGLAAAFAAGMSVVVVPDPNMDHKAFAGAHQIIDSLMTFVPESWGLPPYPVTND